VSWICVLQRGQSGDGYSIGLILFLYEVRSGDLLVLSCASVTLVCLGRFNSDLSIGEFDIRVILLGGMVFRYLLTMVV